MWKWFVLLLLSQWRTLLSEPLGSDNVREPRQLNFGECCPCHESPRSDYDAIEAASTLDNCPCLTAPDSETAPSIFTPTVREPFMRSNDAKTPKPLLKPEVGLASSVLETLKEVTDQEYQEALVRDATRTALNDNEEDQLEPEMANTPRNIVNIILQPKDGHTMDDVMPEASHVQETRCVHPPLGRASSFDQMRFKPKNNVLGFPSSTTKSGKNIFDMANSASNIQEHKMPLKSNILEDLKLKSDLLKMKLFSNSKNSLKDTFSNSNKLNQFDKQSDNENSNNIYNRVPNYKLGSLLDYLKATKQKNNVPNSLQETNRGSEDISFLPSNQQNDYLRNNENIRHLSKNDKLLRNTEESVKENYNSNEKYLNDEFIEPQISDMYKQSTQLMESNAKEPNSAKIKENEKYDCDVNLSMPRNYKQTAHSKSAESMDAETSPTELKISVVDEPINRMSNEKYLNEDWKNDKHPSTARNNNMLNQISVKETEPENYDVKENKYIITKTVENDEIENDSSDGHSCDADEAGSSDVLQIANIPQTKDKNSVDNVNDFGIQEKQQLNTATPSLTTTENSFINNDIYKTKDNKIFTNIKADVFKTLEKIKTANAKIQDKLRFNARNVQKLDVINNSSTEIESSTFKIPKNDTDDNNNNINTQDLQEMSDRILNLSLSNEKSKLEEPLVPDSTVNESSDTNIAENMDSETSPSESRNTVISTDNLSETKDSLLKSSDGITDIVDTLNENNENRDKINDDIIDSTSRQNLCENITPQFSDNTEASSSNDQEKEMMSQASSPYVNSVRHTQDVIVQPETNSNVQGFLDNLKSSLSDIFNNNENINTNKGRDNDNNNSNKNSKYFEKSSFSFDEPRKIDAVKSNPQTRTRDDLSNWDKNNRLKSYKARVPSPVSLNLKTEPSLSNRKQDTLREPFKDDSEVKSASTIFQYPVEMPRSSSFRIPTDNSKKHYDSNFKLPQSHRLQDILPSTESLNSFSENFKSRTDDALRNIKDSIDDLRNSHLTNQNHLLGEHQMRQNIFRNPLRPNDLDNKLKHFNSDLKDRLSQMSQRIPDILPFDDKSTLQAKNTIKNLNDRIKSNSKYKPQVKSNDLPKSRTNLALKPASILGSSKKGVSKSNLHQKLNPSPNTLSDNLRQLEDYLHLHKLESKAPLRKEIKRKPLKENKVTFSFTTSRPEIGKLRPNHKFNKLTPESLRSLIRLPKPPYKSPLQKSLESKFKPSELNHAASNQFTSHVAPDMKLGNPRTAFSSLEESMTSPKVSENTKPKNSEFNLKNIPERYETKNGLLSKMRDAMKAKNIASDSDSNKKFLYNSNDKLKSIALPDAKQSASNNINIVTPSLTDRPLKENVSYKCKMICVEDNEDSK